MPLIPITVRDLAGKQREIEIENDAGVTIDTLKAKIARAFGVSADSFTVMYNGGPMQPGCTLDDLGLQPNELLSTVTIGLGG